MQAVPPFLQVGHALPRSSKARSAISRAASPATTGFEPGVESV